MVLLEVNVWLVDIYNRNLTGDSLDENNKLNLHICNDNGGYLDESIYNHNEERLKKIILKNGLK